MQSIAKLTVGPDATILEAMQVIDKGGLQIALVVDKETQKLLGVVTDGDVRRAVLAKRGLDNSVSGVMNKDPHVLPVGVNYESIRAEIEKYQIHQVPIVDTCGRVIEIVNTYELLLKSRMPYHVVIMAGGLGKRLRPLTQVLPKPLVEVGGRPILETIIKQLHAQHFHNIHISLNYMGDKISEYFGDGSEYGVDIQYLREDCPRGTAASLKLLDRKRIQEPLIVMNGDILTTVDMRKLLQFHLQINAQATMAVIEHSYEVPYGVVELDQENIVKFDEKPSYRFFVNAGIYVISPECLDIIPSDEFFDMPALFERISKNNGKTAAFPIREYWMDIGQPADLNQARNEYSEIFGETELKQ